MFTPLTLTEQCILSPAFLTASSSENNHNHLPQPRPRASSDSSASIAKMQVLNQRQPHAALGAYSLGSSPLTQLEPRIRASGTSRLHHTGACPSSSSTLRCQVPQQLFLIFIANLQTTTRSCEIFHRIRFLLVTNAIGGKDLASQVPGWF